MNRKIIAVTGANKGKGFALVKRLLLESTMYDTVVLCSHDRQKGVEAYKSLRPFFKHPRNLEIADLESSRLDSVQRFADWLYHYMGPLHAIVHNAGIMIKDPQASLEEKVAKTAETNLFGVINLTEALLSRDLLQTGGKIINVSSKLGSASFIRNAALKERVQNVNSYQDIHALFQWQLQEARYGTLPSNFLPDIPFQEYSFQDLLLEEYTKLLVRDPRVVQKQLEVHSQCPDWCKTDVEEDLASESAEKSRNISFELLQDTADLHPDPLGKLSTRANRRTGV